MSEEENPFGINITKRLVSIGAESLLYNPYKIGDTGEVRLVDYMGGDEMVERVATTGMGASAFKEKPSREDLLDYLSNNRILTPFKSVQLKIGFQMPIYNALSFVYSRNCSVNEHSLRYSPPVDGSYVPTIREIQSQSRGISEEKASKIREIILANRAQQLGAYDTLTEDNDMTRELARTVIGSDQDTRFYWKMDLLSLSEWIKEQKSKSKDARANLDPFVDVVDYVARKTAPMAWKALTTRKPIDFRQLTYPKDKEIVDTPLAPPAWTANETRRLIVPGVEGRLFKQIPLLGDGLFQAVDYMGNDDSITDAARTSYAGRKSQENRGLLRHLIRNAHTSPIEMAELAVESRVPFFTDPRQAGRHRTLDFSSFMDIVPLGNLRYNIPDSELKYQTKDNKQGRGKAMDSQESLFTRKILNQSKEETLLAVKKLEELNAPEPFIRQVKGVGHFTKVWRTGDAHNFGHFLRLRLDSHAQKEVRDYAQLVCETLSSQLPVTTEAISDYVLNGMRLSKMEIAFLRERGLLNVDTRKVGDLAEFFSNPVFVQTKRDGSLGLTREGQEFVAKLNQLTQ